MRGHGCAVGRTIAALLVLLGWGVAPSAAQLLDFIAVRVGSRVITWSHVLQEAEVQRVEKGAEAQPSALRVRDELLRRELLYAEAERLRLTVDAESAAHQAAVLVAAWGEAEWESLARYGVGRAQVAERVRRQLVAEQFLSFRREMTFVPERDVRAAYATEAEDFGGRPLDEVRDEVRARLAESAFQRELEQWIERKIAEGGVVVNPIPEG
ncbi:MAG: hypothetical protein SCH98_06665 [Deferrisomatales bacterium]|nr:hypothetical protein [Deferrisomatales bacterium]